MTQYGTGGFCGFYVFMAFRLLDNSIAFPALYPKVERELATVKKKSKTVVGGFTLRHNVD